MFLFTDIEGSTRLWELDSGAMREALERHDTIMSAALSENGDYVFYWWRRLRGSL